METVVGEILLDEIPSIAETNNEFVYAVMRIDLHDVPKYRATANFNHRLGPKFGFLADPSTQTSCKYNSSLDHDAPKH